MVKQFERFKDVWSKTSITQPIISRQFNYDKNEMDQLPVFGVIAACAIVQSIFGIGILVFGTPTLLLMGYDFVATLSFLLPASFAISLLQVLGAGEDRVKISNHLYLLCLPSIGAGLWIAATTPLASYVRGMVGAALVLSALLRLSAFTRTYFNTSLTRNSSAYHIAMGAVHGLTNLGGAMLAVLAGSLSSDKAGVRYIVAHYYLAFSVIQMLVLIISVDAFGQLVANLPMAIISAATYLLIGNRLFAAASMPIFDKALTAFIAIYGALILATL